MARKNPRKIYLQRPWRFSDSPYYKYLFTELPKNVEYINIAGKHQGIIEDNARKMKLLNFLKENIKRTVQLFPYLPNAHLTKSLKKYDLIHCAHCLSLNKTSWICDIEYANQLWACGRANKKKRRLILKILKSGYCKKILAWTEWAKERVSELFPEIENKIEIVYPAMLLPEFKKEKSEKIKLLFSSRRFYFKGGLHAIEVIDRLTKKYKNIEGIIVSDIPKEILEKYSKNEKIKFFDLMSQEKLFKKIYPQSDIFIYPSHTDTFGFGYLEAMAFGLPIIGIQGPCNKEIIEDGKTGFIIPKSKNLDYRILKGQGEIIEKLIKKTTILIEDRELREKMSENSRKEIESGKFSIKERNKKLKKIYEEALK